ncbi:hypothetical protein TCDM_01908 [Trypanosoma cruzi Dm28c]|uniref:Uncharacterized protein n=1 Tax=Trypanosoma cruzi Dm28c TaxID=1416333 RepID=V5B806_TRYCR|nr:hypothetical protein TCDM_01908 [Trypanosoma cruzi Dm28c]
MLEGGRLLFINGTALSRLTVLRVGHMVVNLLIRKGPRSFSSGISFRLRDIRRGAVAVGLSGWQSVCAHSSSPPLTTVSTLPEGVPLIYSSFIPSLLDGASSLPQRVSPTSHAHRQTHANSTFFGLLSVPWGKRNRRSVPDFVQKIEFLCSSFVGNARLFDVACFVNAGLLLQNNNNCLFVSK